MQQDRIQTEQIDCFSSPGGWAPALSSLDVDYYRGDGSHLSKKSDQGSFAGMGKLVLIQTDSLRERFIAVFRMSSNSDFRMPTYHSSHLYGFEPV